MGGSKCPKRKSLNCFNQILELKPDSLRISDCVTSSCLCGACLLTWWFEGDLALLALGVVSDKSVSEEVRGDGPLVRVRLEAAQNERLGLQRQGLWDLGVDLKHAHLSRRRTHRPATVIETQVSIYHLNSSMKVQNVGTQHRP